MNAVFAIGNRIVAKVEGSPKEIAEFAERIGSGRQVGSSEPSAPKPKNSKSPNIAQSSSGRALILFRQVSDPTRLKILEMLYEGERNVSELVEGLGDQSQPAVSHHLALLRASEVVETTREGQFNYYFITKEGENIVRIISGLGKFEDFDVCEIFKVASDPTRLKILEMLYEGERNVSELVEGLGDQSQPAVSHHLARIRGSGLVESRRDGKHCSYSLTDIGYKFVDTISSCFQ